MARTASLSLRRRALLAGASAGALSMPWVAGAQARTIRIGMQTILSGAVALLGTSSRNAVTIEVEKINAAGGLAGRPIEIVLRDSKGQPQEAARVARELVNTDGCEILLDAEASSSSFAVQEVVRDLGVLCLHSASETSSLTADPKLRVPTAFRCARQGIHDGIVGGVHAAKVANARKLTKWASCSPDYAYGRDTTAQFFEYLKLFKPDVEIVSQAWPKLMQPDFTEVITKIIQARPQALYSALWTGDLSSYINQGNIYALFNQMTVFAVNMADYPVLLAVKQLPAGIQSGTRYLDSFPLTDSNKEWGQTYLKRWKEYPTNWAWEAAACMHFIDAAAKKAGAADGHKMAEALRGLTIPSPFGAKGTLTMRAEDNTLIDYVAGWGTTIPKDPYIVDIAAGDWGQIVELEADWKKKQNYA
jgi:branched-chain amino acid transport system substrate-binding protein